MFKKSRSTINEHILNIFREGELDERVSVRKIGNSDFSGNMGLTSFSGREPQLKDAVIAKNYLDEKELRVLGQIVSGYLDFAERQAERQVPMKMEDWAKHLDQILVSTGEKLLEGAGNISHADATNKARDEYKKYRQRVLSSAEDDFLDSISKLANNGKNL